MARTLPAEQHPFGRRAGPRAPPLGSPRVPREPKSVPARKVVSFNLEVDYDSEGLLTRGGQSGTPDSLDCAPQQPALPALGAPAHSSAGHSTASWLSSLGSSQEHSVEIVRLASPLLVDSEQESCELQPGGHRDKCARYPDGCAERGLGAGGGGGVTTAGASQARPASGTPGPPVAPGDASGALQPLDQPLEPLERAGPPVALGGAPGASQPLDQPLEHLERAVPPVALGGAAGASQPLDGPLGPLDRAVLPVALGGAAGASQPLDQPLEPLDPALWQQAFGDAAAAAGAAPGTLRRRSQQEAPSETGVGSSAAPGAPGPPAEERHRSQQEAQGETGGGSTAPGSCSRAPRPPAAESHCPQQELPSETGGGGGSAAPGSCSGAPRPPAAESHRSQQEAQGETGGGGSAAPGSCSGAPRPPAAERHYSQQEAQGETGGGGSGSAAPGSCSGAPRPPAAESHRSQQEALRDMRLLEEQAQRAAGALMSRPHRCTAAAKWAFAHGVARGAPHIEAWGGGGGGRHASGAYTYLPGENAQEPPAYQSAAYPSQRLRVSPQGHWLLGSPDASDEQQRRQRGHLRSARPVEPGVLPHAVSEWEAVPGAGDLHPAASRVRFWLAETVRLEWQKARVASCDCPVVSVQGVGRLGDGLYDFVPREGSAGEPPAYQHQVQRNLWLYLASDQCWWVGSEQGLAEKAPQGLAQSPPVQPGRRPCDDDVAGCWTVCADAAGGQMQQEVEVRPEPAELTASDKWGEACRRAGAVQLWGAPRERGVYRPAGDGARCGEPPAYRCEQQPDLWLYVADDWHWCIGPTSSKDRRRPAAVARSRGEAVAGALPEEVAAWCEQGDKEAWEHDPNLRFFRAEYVAEAWRRAREACDEAPVVTLTGAPRGLEEYGGLYDFTPEATAHDEAPAFRHQVDRERWLYLGADCRWCVGDRSDLDGRRPAGRVRSLLVSPGQLPTAAAWQVRRAQHSMWDNPSRFARTPFACIAQRSP